MNRSPLAIAVVSALAATIAIGVSIGHGASSDTSCWDEYDASGTRFYRTIVPRDQSPDDCTPAAGCLDGYNARGRKNRLYVPHGTDPATACTTPSTTLPPTTTSPTTTAPTTEPPPPPPPGDRFETLPVGADLPSGAECASRVRPMTENRPENATANQRRGIGNDASYPRVDGDFVGTTDEIIQWAACKWGIDEDWVRAQIVNESWWKQTTLGDFTTDPDACIPGMPIGNYPPQYDGDRDHVGECPESVGVGQVRWLYHTSAFANDNAIESTAYNIDYTYAIWRTCFEGGFPWLNDVERGATYVAGDARGCVGVWFSGRWYTDAAVGYMERFDQTLANRTWEHVDFGPAFPVIRPTDPPPSTTEPPPPTTAPPTTAPPTTAPPTTAPPTTAPPTTAPPSDGAFVEDFAGNGGLERFDTGMYHRDDVLVATTQWTGDHDLACGSPDTQRTIRRDRPADSFYTCRDHLMTSIGDTSGYSIGWFSPKQTFRGGEHTVVSWDVNVTDLGARQWWEVSIVPVGGAFLATVDWVAETAGVEAYDEHAIVVGKGPLGNDGAILTRGVERDPLGWGHVCGDWGVDPEGCASKKIRRTFTVTDNLDGTVTIDFLGERYTYPGSFPSEFKVYFKDHNYTPNKDEMPVGHTWHWDNIVVR